MIRSELLRDIPTRRVTAIDGMAVTAKVWEEAHEYHRQSLRGHLKLSHGAGILAGLEVIASDPVDSTVYILPGAAIDPNGDLIVLREPAAFDMGSGMTGTIRLFLTHGESRPARLGGDEPPDEPLYTQAEFGLEAVGLATAISGVELARVRRTERMAPICNAGQREHPGPNELDMRYRCEAQPSMASVASVGICRLGGDAGSHDRGLDNLARHLAHHDRLHLCIDQDVRLGGDLTGYTLLYLVANGPFELGPGEMNGLYGYLSNGGTILAEGCLHLQEAGGTGIDRSFADLLAALGLTLAPLESGHELLSNPYLFASPPAGGADVEQPRLSIGDGVLLSTADYGCLWQGERCQGPAGREEIRAAMEWGANIMASALRRAEAAKSAHQP